MFYSQQRLSYPIGFRNDDAATLPGMSIACVTGAEFKDNELILILAKPSTTFKNFCAITEPVDCAASGYGRCAISGIVPVKYDSGTPAFDEGWGLKPSQWTISKGFPGCTIVGIVDSTNKIAMVSLDSLITTLLGKTTGAVTGGSATTSYRIYAGGTLGSEADAGFTTVPSALSLTDIDTTKWIKLTFLANGWRIEPLECNG